MIDPIRVGMVGGGTGAFIGPVHRAALALDGEARLLAGALSADPDRALASARALGLPRPYPSWRDMLNRERALPAAESVELVVIVTPNDSHAQIAAAFLDAGFHVALDKPMTRTLAEAEDLARRAEHARSLLAVTYNYAGYPLVKEAANLVRAGTLGPIRKVLVEYHQGWLASALESTGQKQAAWRSDPTRAGAGALGDIGSHAEHLASTVTCLDLDAVSARLHTFVPGRRVDDDATVLLRFKGGATGLLSASQVCVGAENALSIRVHGASGSLEWRQEDPNRLTLSTLDAGTRVITRASPGLSPAAALATRLPPGHPEGFFEAFANVYRGIFDAIRAHRQGRSPSGLGAEVAGVREGLRGMRFIAACQESSARGGAWISM